MPRSLNEHQRRCVNAIMERMSEYMDLRYGMVCRANPRLKNIWPDLAWLHLQQMRNTLSGDKAWGPNRYVVAELLCSDDDRKIRDLFTPTNQVSLHGEIVDKRDRDEAKREDVMPIHDFSTMIGAVDSTMVDLALLVQVFLYWDLPDGADLARFHFKEDLVRRVKEGLNQQQIDAYAKMMDRVDNPPDQEEILMHEMRRLKYIHDRFVSRRHGEPGHRLILARRPASEDDSADRLISAIARQKILLKSIEDGQAIDENVRGQFAAALHVSPDDLTPEMEKDYLQKLIAENRRKLSAAISGEESGGEPYNFKAEQVRKIGATLKELVGDRDLIQEEVTTPSSASVSTTSARMI